MTLYIVTFIVPARYTPDTDAPMAFAFLDRSEADQFASHMRSLYGFETTTEPIRDTTYTYDTAIQAVVEAIGPSPD